MATRLWWRGLLARVTLTYAFGALALSATVALSTFALAQNRLLAEVESAHRNQAYNNAIDVRQRLLALAPVVEEGLVAASTAEAEAAAAALDGPTATEVDGSAPVAPADDDGSANGANSADGAESAAGAGLDTSGLDISGGAATTALNGSDDSGADGTGADPASVDAEQSAETEAEEAVEAASDIYITILGELRRPNGSLVLLVLEDNTERSLTLSRRNIPVALQTAIDPVEGISDKPAMDIAQLRYQDTDAVRYAVGIRLDDVDVLYYEVLPLTELEDTLRSLRVILVGVAVVASIAGAGLGFYSARGALAPLPRISGAARSIAAGDFSTRLDLEDDPDLAVLTEAFNEMVDAVSDRIEREQRFTSDVSHELRSPLMTLTASVEILERRKESLPDVAQQAIDLLSQDLHRFQNLVEDLLEVSRMEAGAVQLQLSRFKLSEFLENVIFQSRAPHLELLYEEQDANTFITADKRRLAQVMTNLLDNAEKYGEGAAGVRFEVVGESVQIVVDDAGRGVPANQRERIFERFGRVDSGNRGVADGFGLGLSLVAEHVRLHGGQVWVTDRIDGQRGARFVVQLPLGEHIDILEEMAE